MAGGPPAGTIVDAMAKSDKSGANDLLRAARELRAKLSAAEPAGIPAGKRKALREATEELLRELPNLLRGLDPVKLVGFRLPPLGRGCDRCAVEPVGDRR